MERGKLALDRKPVEATDLLRRAADVAHASASQARISFRIDAPPVQVLADEERILQVLNELVANAIKFSPPETQIRLAAQPSGERDVCFIVEDQGRGIAPEKLEHIFEQHGGRIWAESTPGQGSRFQFTLPAAAANAQ